MKIYLLLFLTLQLYDQSCIIVKDFTEIQSKVQENPAFESFEIDVLNSNEYYQKVIEDSKEIFTRISCTEEHNNISLCQNFFADYKMFFESESSNMLCITVLKDCKVSQQHFLFRLKMNIYETIITQNSYELAVQYLGGINRMLLKGIKNQMLPLHNKSEKDEEPQDAKIPDWIATLGYFITKEGIMLVFTTKMQMNPTLIEDKHINPDDIGFITQDFVTYIKEFFQQGETCDDMVHNFYTQAGEGLLEVMDEDEFPQSYISTWNWLEENINQGLVEKHKWLMYFLVIGYCEGKVIYDESILHVIHQMMNVQQSYLFDSQEELEYFRDYFVFKQTMDKAKFEEKKEQYVAVSDGSSNQNNENPVDKKDKEVDSEDDEIDVLENSIVTNEEIDPEDTELMKEQKQKNPNPEVIEDPTLNQGEIIDNRLRKLNMEKYQLEKILLSKDINYKK